ncbi:MAG: SMI1/KNR4 family protein [Lachnospiraceae bacterium]|nr:SMI1/KNR4 family protein [Lachnospiraceae bacterium]
MMDYFEALIENLNNNNEYEIQTCVIVRGEFQNSDFLLQLKADKDVLEIYEKYKRVKIIWKHIPSGDYGEVDFVALDEIEKEHNSLVNIMHELYQYIENDKEQIKTDVENWFPIFRFSNGDMFCVDSRNGHVVFYEHEVYDTGIDLHGLVIANDINELFDKWSKCKFFDLYDWSKGVNNQGLDLSKQVFQPHICHKIES